MRMTPTVIIVGGVIVFLAVVIVAVFVPTLLWNPAPTIVAHPYSPEEELGRKVFYSNGCNYCHTQYVRAEDTAMGAVSDGGNYVYDNPMILGSERTGPDLSYVGRKRSQTWEIEHLKDPRQFSPNSIMPSFEFLPDRDMQNLAAYLFALGDRVAQARMIAPPQPYANRVNPLVFAQVAPPSGNEPQGWPTFNQSGLQEGKELYVSRCLTCHGCAGNGLGSYAGTQSVTPADFKQEPFRSMPDDQWFWHVSEGVPGTLMPTWKASLTEDQRWKVIGYIQQVYARPIMHDPDEGDPAGQYADLANPLPLSVDVLDQGKAIFIRECMVCHGDAGRGQGPYRDLLQPRPPDFGDGSYGDYKDADYFWRISEGVPWTAMPAWKVEYGPEERWTLVHYIRTTFTQTETPPPAPPDGQDFLYPDFFKTSMRFPADVSYERGRQTFLTNCAHCHGVAGDGAGWDGQYLNPKPADLRKLAGRGLGPGREGEYLAKVTFGIQGTAMPTWGEFLPLEQRWDAIQYILDTFMVGKPATASVYQPGELPVHFATISSQLYLDEGHVISPTHGVELYGLYCASCHGDQGKGGGLGTVGSMSQGPAVFPADMGANYIYWRTWEGVPNSTMYAFKEQLSTADVWDIVTHVDQLTSTGNGGNK